MARREDILRDYELPSMNGRNYSSSAYDSSPAPIYTMNVNEMSALELVQETCAQLVIQAADRDRKIHDLELRCVAAERNVRDMRMAMQQLAGIMPRIQTLETNAKETKLAINAEHDTHVFMNHYRFSDTAPGNPLNDL